MKNTKRFLRMKRYERLVTPGYVTLRSFFFRDRHGDVHEFQMLRSMLIRHSSGHCQYLGELPSLEAWLQRNRMVLMPDGRPMPYWPVAEGSVAGLDRTPQEEA